jgi:hypothetical protein
MNQTSRLLRRGALIAAVAFAAALAQVALVRPVFAQSPQQIEKAASEAARSLDLQLTLPLEEEKKPSEWSWNWSLPEWLRNWEFRRPTDFDSVLLWIVLAVAVGIVLYVLRDALPFGRPKDTGWETPGSGVEGARAPQSHAEASLTADELARQGRYMEAMHVLLLRGLAEMRLHAGEAFADSLTSREILRNTRLSEAGRESLRDIVIRVEWSYFGEHPVAHSDYAACRQSFDRLVHALHGASGRGAAR